MIQAIHPDEHRYIFSIYKEAKRIQLWDGTANKAIWTANLP